MIRKMMALVALSALAATDASAQAVGTQTWIPNLSGVYRCVRYCSGFRTAHIVQYGRQLSLTSETGQPYSARIDWRGHISTSWNDAAVYSPDGFTIQFDSGSVWVLLDPRPVPGSPDF
jgi:hypothetical protein